MKNILLVFFDVGNRIFCLKSEFVEYNLKGLGSKKLLLQLNSWKCLNYS